MTTSNADASGFALRVSKSDLRDFNLCAIDNDELGLKDGQALLRIDRFALTANNITYGVVGDMMYWNFFPAPEGKGHIPVWGFADVVASQSDAAPVGMRVYGFLPLASHLVVTPKRSSSGFVDNASHRQGLPLVYNSYEQSDPNLGADQEGMQALLRPLFATGLALKTFINENNAFGASRVVIGSASSKTAICLAMLLAQDSRFKITGLTSSSNQAFVANLGCYDEVISYDQLTSMKPDIATMYVDMSGDHNVRSSLHQHLGNNICYDSQVGLTHWEDNASEQTSTAVEPIMFFAPTHIDAMIAAMGSKGFQDHLAQQFATVATSLGTSLTLTHLEGQQAIAATYRETLEGKAAADRGYILSP